MKRLLLICGLMASCGAGKPPSVQTPTKGVAKAPKKYIPPPPPKCKRLVGKIVEEVPCE